MDGVMLHPAIARIASAASGRATGADDGRPVGRDAQRRVLDEILVASGPERVLNAGRHLDVVASDPIVLSLLNSDTPAVLLDKIERLNRYLHSQHRHRVLRIEADGVELEHVSIGTTAPAPVESLFACGLYLELLSRIGCSGIGCAFPDSGAGDRDVFCDGRPENVPADRTARWRIGWTSFEASRSLPALDDVLLHRLPTDLTDRSFSTRVEAVVLGDLGRSWKLARVASRLAVSPRTVQRRLREEGRSFGEVVRSARLTAARDLLADAGRTVTEIGYVTGFADTAHFVRTFKAAEGATPTEWRRRNGGAA